MQSFAKDDTQFLSTGNQKLSRLNFQSSLCHKQLGSTSSIVESNNIVIFCVYSLCSFLGDGQHHMLHISSSNPRRNQNRPQI